MIQGVVEGDEIDLEHTFTLHVSHTYERQRLRSHRR